MDDSQAWAEALNIKPEVYSQWSAEAPAGQPVLIYALLSGLIDVEAYLNWASDEYGLPRVESSFFGKACDRDLVRGARELESYAPWRFPVGRWDDVTFVACAERPADEVPPGYCFVLADPRVMVDLWEQLARDGEVTSLTSVSIGRDADPTADVDVPQGFNATTTKVFTLNLDGVSLNLDGHLSPPVPEPLSPSEPQAEAAEAEAMPRSTDVFADDGEDLALESTSATFVPAATVPKQAPKPTPQPAPKPHAPVRPAQPAAPVVAAKPTIVAEPKKAPKVSTPPAPPRAPSVSGPAAPVSSLTLPTSEAGALTRVFDHLSQNFGGSCILRRTDSMVRLYKWSLGMTPAGQAVALDVNYASFLRIVSRTNLPYHGYLVDSPTHREFFRGLGIDDLPACVTAVPLMVDSVMWGILLAFGPAERQDQASLAIVERAADDLTQALSPAWRKVA